MDQPISNHAVDQPWQYVANYGSISGLRKLYVCNAANSPGEPAVATMNSVGEPLTVITVIARLTKSGQKP